MSPRVRILALVAWIALIAAVLLLAPVKHDLARFIGWIRNAGPWGPVILASVFAGACLLAVPSAALGIASGFALGLLEGVPAASAGIIVGASMCFAVGRTLARHLIERLAARSPRLHRLDGAVAREGFTIVLWTRLSPLFPSNILNYFFGATRVSFRDFVVASWLGMLPMTVVWVYVGTLVRSLAESPRAPNSFVFVAGLAATVIATAVIARMASRALKEKTEV